MAKPGAPIFVSVMGRISVLVVILMIAQDEIEMPHFKQIRETGDYFGGHGFTACHFYLPDELRGEFTQGRTKDIRAGGIGRDQYGSYEGA